MSTEPTLLASLVAGHTDAREEAQVLDLLRTLPADQLDAALAEVDAAELFRSLDDRLVGPDNHTALRDVLLARMGEMSMQTRANLAYGWQARRTERADEEAIRDLFLSYSGEELTHFKNLVNSRKDAHDLEGLIFRDIDDAGIRDEILTHIAAQAASVEPHEAKVLCDIDDTVICALHDRRYPKGTIYPGVLALLDALDRGPDPDTFSMGDLTFVTARPGDVFGLIENHTKHALTEAGIATHSVLTGTVQALLTKDLMAGQKIANIDHYNKLFPEYRLMFIGDSGQGDIRVGELMLEKFGHLVDIVVIHDVVGRSAEDRAELATKGIHLVDTYIDAAVLMHERDLISQAGLEKVRSEALEALDKVAWQSPEQEASTRRLFARATGQAN